MRNCGGASAIGKSMAKTQVLLGLMRDGGALQQGRATAQTTKGANEARDARNNILLQLAKMDPTAAQAFLDA